MKKSRIVYYKHIALKPRVIRSFNKSAGFTISKQDAKTYDISKGDWLRPILYTKGFTIEHPIPFSKVVRIGDNLGIRISAKIMKNQDLRIGTKVNIILQQPCYEYKNDITKNGKNFVFIVGKKDGLIIEDDLKINEIEYRLLR